MTAGQVASMSARAVKAVIVYASLLPLVFGNSFAYAQNPSRDNDTVSPIKHVIVIIGENRSFDHVFATYVPRRGQTIWNLLSEGIINANGTPGPNFDKAEQNAAYDEKPDGFLLSPTKTEFPGAVLPAPQVGGPENSYVANDSLTLAEQSENGLPSGYYQYLISGGTGQSSSTPDARISNVNSLPARAFPADQRKHLHL